MEHAEATWKGVADVVAVEQAFEDYFELEQVRLLRLLWMVSGSLKEAEDILQDAFLRVWERWHKVSSMESPTGYLHHAARIPIACSRSRTRTEPTTARSASASGPWHPAPSL
jgi:RNA polymerase sigma-70 factor (ECF subfamily)